jgi:hypothetical protein
MSDEPKKRSRAWIGWAAFVLLVLYPLSVGPALKWTSDDLSTWRIIAPVYDPLFRLGERFDCIGDALNWYLPWWIEESG